MIASNAASRKITTSPSGAKFQKDDLPLFLLYKLLFACFEGASVSTCVSRLFCVK
jgi:hypothetical protein